MTRGKIEQRKAAQAKKATDKENRQNRLKKKKTWEKKKRTRDTIQETNIISTVHNQLKSCGVEPHGEYILYRGMDFHYVVSDKGITVYTNEGRSSFNTYSGDLGAAVREFLDGVIDSSQGRGSRSWRSIDNP